MNDPNWCPFTKMPCTGGKIYDDGSIGCVFKVDENGDPDENGVCEFKRTVQPSTRRAFYQQCIAEVLMQ